MNGCTSLTGSGTSAPKTTPGAPTVKVIDNCDGSSDLTASDYTGDLLWSNGATTATIHVTDAATYTVTQTVNGCTSLAGSGTSAPKSKPITGITVDPQTCTGGVAQFKLTATGNGTLFVWSKSAGADGSFSTTTNSPTVYTPGANDKTNGVTITLTTSLNGCTNTATTTLKTTSCGPYYTVTQGFYGNVGGKACSPSGTLYTSGTKGNVDGLIATSIKNMPGQQLKLGISGNNRTFTMGYTSTEDKNLITYMPATQTATAITANSGTNNNTNILNNLPKLYNKKISDVLLGQTITLALNVYIPKNTLGSFVLQNGYLTTQKADPSNCSAPKVLLCSKDNTSISSLQITTNAGLKAWINSGGKTVSDLLNLASNALGGGNIATLTGQSGVTLSDINNAVDVINRSFDGGRFFIGYYTTQQSCSTLSSSSIASVSVSNPGTTVSNLSVKAYPNPYTSSVNFRFVSPVSGKATLEIYSLLGQRLAIIDKGKIDAGIESSFTYNVPVSNRVPVMYKVTVGTRTFRGTLIPAK